MSGLLIKAVIIMFVVRIVLRSIRQLLGSSTTINQAGTQGPEQGEFREVDDKE